MIEKKTGNLKKIAGFVSAFCEKDKTLPFDPSGVAAVAEYASQLADDQKKLSTRFTDLIQILTDIMSLYIFYEER